MNSIKRIVQEPPSRPAITIDDWVRQTVNRDAGVEFTIAKLSDKGKVVCRLRCYHHGSYVSTEGRPEPAGDAFLTALAQIEQTIGRVW